MSGPTAGGTGLTEESRREAEEHIREHVEVEAARIGRLSRIRELVLGFQDGLLVPLGVVSGLAAAGPARSVILVAGLAEAVAGAIAMGGGSYLASEAEERLYRAEVAEERREILEHPGREQAELAIILEREGLPRQSAEEVARGLAAHPDVFLRTKVEKELGIPVDAGGAALGDALVVGASYAVAAIIPLWPYAVMSIGTAFWVSLGCTLAALYALGAVKGRIARQRSWAAGLQVMLIGGVSAAVGFGIGHVISAIAG